MGKRRVEMVETITVKNLPDEFSGTYEVDGTVNHITARFIDLGNNRTKYISESEFIFSSFMMKVFAFIMPGMFKKQSLENMQRFKEFAESSG